MRNLKKALSVFLCAVMMFTTLCFFTITDAEVTADAAVVNTDSDLAFYVPETIYLYPDVTSWKSAVASPFQYYVGNTVDTDDIYAVPKAEANIDSAGKIYFASEEGMENASLSVKYLNLLGQYISEENYGTVTFTKEDKGDYYLFTVTDGMSPVLEANEDGVYIEWCVTYTTDKGERKAAFNYSYIYKPYVVPYGAAARVFNEKGDVNVYGQHITWVTGVHSADNTMAQSNTLFPRYQTVDASSSGVYAFSPFLSKDNKAYVAGAEVSGAADVKYGGYNAVFSGDNAETAYFWAGQTNASMTASNRVMSWFYTANTDTTYPVAFDYSNNATVSAAYALSQVTPTRLGAINVDISRYGNLNEIPNLAVGMMTTDVDYRDALTSSTAVPTAQWYVGDATGLTHSATGAYDTKDAIDTAGDNVNTKFASQKNVTSDTIGHGILYAGVWDKELTGTAGNETYTVKSYYESVDRELDRQAVSSAVSLNVNQIDKSALRETVDRATSYLGALGVKENWNSYYYDINYIDPDTNASAWNRFKAAYVNACGALSNVNLETALKNYGYNIEVSYEEYRLELEASLEALLNGKGLRVYFDVNHDDIGVNLWINPASTGIYTWNSDNETAVINGTVSTDGHTYGTTPFTPDGGAYTFSTSVISGSFSGYGCTVFDSVKADNTNATNSSGVRYNYDFTTDKTSVITYADADAINVEGIKFWTWYYADMGAGNYDNLALNLKIEKGSTKTAYSPAGKVAGATYGTLPVPTRVGYTFEGWYTDETLTTKVTAESQPSARILYANWTANSYSLSYDNLISINEWANHGNSSNTAGEAANGFVEYDAASSSVKITSANIQGECYTIWDSASYSVPVKPNTSYRFSYTVSGHNGVGRHQAFAFIYADGATVGFADGVGWADVNKYTAGSGDFYIDFTTGENAEEFRFRIGTHNGSNSDVVTATFSDIKLIEKTDYNLSLNISATEKAVEFDAAGYGELATATREGYVFDGWYTEPDGQGEEITASTAVKSENITVYSKWIPNQYSVAFDGNTGIGGLGLTNAQYDTPFELPANYFIKTGYTFIGWSTSPDGEVLYGDKEEVMNLTSEVNGSVTLYAIWQANTFTVKFDANTASGNMADTDVVYDSEVKLPECGFTKTGYTFIGWSLTSDGAVLLTDKEYDNLCTEEGDTVTLYAIWSENSYTLSFDANGGEGASIPPTVYGYETEVALPKNVFTKKGYTLSGWSLTKDGEQVYANGEVVKHINPDKNGRITLYAVWTPVNYTVSFEPNTGSGTMETVSATYDKSFVLPANTLTKEGYHFLGWATTASGEVMYEDGATAENLTDTEGKNVVLYAVWEINTYTVTFKYYNNQGTYVSVAVKTNHGEAAKVPTDFTTTPYKDSSAHRIFSKWSVDFSSVTSDLTVEARYPSGSEEAHEMKTTVKDSTCTAVGSTRHYCSKCSYSYSEEIPMKEHSWDSGKVETEAGCLTNGSFVYECTVCGTTKAEVISPLGHDFTDFPANNPTCEEEGNIAHKHCERCKQCFSSDALVTAPDSEALTDEDVKISKLPHTPGAAATCDTAQTCTVCGCVLAEALGHTQETTIENIDATCTTEGTYKETVTCIVCGVSETEIKTGKLPHEYEGTKTEPTCTEQGYTTFRCAVCGDTYKAEYVDKKGHTEGEWTEISAPTCTASGKEENTCSVCGTKWKTRDVAANGHDSGEWKVTTPAECEKWGTESLVCTICNEVITTRGIAPKGHGETKLEVTLEPGCETAGKESKLCVDCGVELSFNIIPEKGHTPGAEETCETDQTCTVCSEVLKERTGHAWDEGEVTKQATDKEEGEITYTCKNDSTHKYTEKTPINTSIILPELPSGGTYKIDADENGNGGNIYDFVTVEDGKNVYFTVSDPSVISVDFDGNITVLGDGVAKITITLTDGSYSRTLPVTLRTPKTVIFDANGNETVVKAYKGDKVTPPEVESYKDADGFVHSFKAWSLGGAETENFTVTGDMTFVAVYTTGCDYREIDRLEEVLTTVLSGVYDNNNEIILNKTAIDNAKAIIASYKENRDTRDVSQQATLDAACKEIAGIIAKLYPIDATTVEIRGNLTPDAGTVVSLKAYLMPLDSELSECIWTSSDNSIGFFSDNMFYAVGSGTVTVTVASGDFTGTAEVTVKGAAGARVIMFDTLMSNVSYIVEDTYIIKSTTNIFWATNAPVRFRVVSTASFDQDFVYINDIIVEADESGYYTIPANMGDVHVKVMGVVEDTDGERWSFWEMILNFFNKIAEFFANLFSF